MRRAGAIRWWGLLAITSVSMGSWRPCHAGTAPLAIAYGFGPAIGFASDSGGIVVALEPWTKELPDGTEVPWLRYLGPSGLLGPSLPSLPGFGDFTGMMGGLPAVATLRAPGPVWVASLRSSVTDGERLGLIVGRYDAADGRPGQDVWYLTPGENETIGSLGLVVQGDAARPEAATAFVTYSRYDASVDEEDGDNYLSSHLHVVAGNGNDRKIDVSRVEDRSTVDNEFRGSRLQPVVGATAGQLFLLGTGVLIDDPSLFSLHFHELPGVLAPLDSAKGRLPAFRRPGQPLVPADDRFALNGHSVGEFAAFAADRTNGRLYVAFVQNPNPSNAALDQSDLRFARSDDRAMTWRFDGTDAPLDGLRIELGKSQFLPAIDVDDNGWVHVAYLQDDSGSVNRGAFRAATAHLYYTASKDGGDSWSQPIRISDDASGLRFDDRADAATVAFLGSRQALKAQSGAAGTVIQICWPSYDYAREERILVVCSSITNPFCDDDTLDPGEVCKHGDPSNRGCCSSTCRAETGMPCEDRNDHCTENDRCGADGTCQGGTVITAEKVLPQIQQDLWGDECAGVDLPSRLQNGWGDARALLEHIIGPLPTSPCDLWRARAAHSRLFDLHASWMGRRGKRMRKRLSEECSSRLDRLILGAVGHAKCWSQPLMQPPPKKKGKRCKRPGFTPASDGP